MAEIKLTEQNFETEVINSDIPVLVDFWAPWCGPCRMLAPVLEELSQEYEGTAKVGKVNIDEEMKLAQRYDISSIPTVMFFKGGKVESVSVGVHPKADIEAMID